MGLFIARIQLHRIPRIHTPTYNVSRETTEFNTLKKTNIFIYIL
jgi:hypothetical protein